MYKFFAGFLVVFIISTGVEARNVFNPEFDELDDDLGPTAHTVSIQTGTFYIKNLGQNINPGNVFIFSEESDTAIGLEYLFHFNDNNAIGAQIFHYTTNYVSTLGGGQKEIDTELIMFTYKGHMRVASWFRPFIHFSGGIAGVTLNEPAIDGLVGLAFGVGGGFYFPFSSHVGLTAEYRYLGGKVVDVDDNELNLESDALLASLNIIF